MTNQEFNVHLQSVRSLKFKIEWLNWQEHKTGETQGSLLDGSISIDRSSPVRRTCNLTFVVSDDKFIPKPDSYIWLNRKFRLYIGIEDLLTGETQYFNQGIYVVNSPSLSYSTSSKTISIEGLDKMCLYNGVLDGKLLNPVIIPVDTDINTAMKSTLETIGGETKFNMDKINKLLPYTLEKSSGDTIYDILKELSELYMDWSEIYFDVEGYFIFEKNKERGNDPIIWDFKQNDFVVNYMSEPDFTNVKNHIVVWGYQWDNGTQIKHEIENNDVNSDFSIAKIGRKSLPITDENLFLAEQAQSRAEWELKIHSNLNEIINISSVPIYRLDVNQLIYFDTPEIGVQGKYLIDSISIPLDVSSAMTIKAHKIYT